MKKILTIAILLSLVLFMAWSYIPTSSISNIKEKIEASGIDTTAGGPARKEVVESNGDTYSQLKNATNNTYFEQYRFANSSGVEEWWFVYNLDDNNQAHVVIDFSFTNNCVNTANTPIRIEFQGAAIEGDITDIPCNEPTDDTDLTVVMDDGSTGKITYSPSNSTFEVKAD